MHTHDLVISQERKFLFYPKDEVPLATIFKINASLNVSYLGGENSPYINSLLVHPRLKRAEQNLMEAHPLGHFLVHVERERNRRLFEDNKGSVSTLKSAILSALLG